MLQLRHSLVARPKEFAVRFFPPLAPALFVVTPAFGQGFNVDVGIEGVPSFALASAGEQCGTWNEVSDATSLVALDGGSTSLSVTIAGSPGASFTSFDHPQIDGDLAALLEDFLVVPAGSSVTFAFSELPFGFYRVVTYAWMPTGATGTIVDVPQSIVSSPQFLGGPWGGTLEPGVTHAVHDGVLGSFDVVVFAPADGPAVVSGFQLVPTTLGADVGIVYCESPVPTTTGSPAYLNATGSSSVSQNDLVLEAFDLPRGPAHTGLFIASPDQAEVPLGGGTLCLGATTLGFVVRLFPAFASDAQGRATLALDHTRPSVHEAQVFPGSTWNYQAWFRDFPGGTSSFNFTSAVAITFCP